MTTNPNAEPVSDFPVLDRLPAQSDDGGRVVQASFGVLEPYIAETDDWIGLPLRLVHDQFGGWQIELGPYSLDAADILRLKEAIAAYDDATGNRSGEAK